MGFTDRARGKQIAAQLWIKRLIRSNAGPLTAFAGGGRTNATALGYGINRISVCATAADSVQLPAWIPGAEVIVVNDGAAAAQVFGKTGSTDTIDGIATATGVPLTNATRCAYYGDSATGSWLSLKGTKSS